MGSRVSGLSRRKTALAKMRQQKAMKMYIPRTAGALYASERKYFDSYVSALALTAPSTWAGTEADPGTLNCLFCPTEGSDIDNRVGRKVTVHSIKINGTINVPDKANLTGCDNATLLRMILFVDMQTNATQAQGEQLMSDPGAASALLNINTFQNTANFGRFKVLRDVKLSLQNPVITYDGTNLEQNGMKRQFKLKYKFVNGLPVRFNAANGGSVADIIDNSFHLLAACDSIDLAPTISYQARTVYTDK